MLSGPIDEEVGIAAAGAALAPDDTEPAAEPETAPSGIRDTRPRGWLKRLLPRTMFGRSLLIVVMPLVLLQAIAAWIFYDRHWAAVSWRLASGVAGDIALTIEALEFAQSPAATARLLHNAAVAADLRRLTLRRGASLPPPLPPARIGGETLVETQLNAALHGRIALPYRVEAPGDSGGDSAGDPGGVRIEVQLSRGVLRADVSRDRLSSPTTYIFVMWMVGSSVVLLAVATVFLRNQVKSLRRLAAAADGFGKGRPVPFFKVEGAVEIRQAAVAFLRMRDRIQRQIRQRTQMLAGVSHDLRTPLTRMKLALELLGGDLAVEELRSDVAEMEHMVHGYLDFVRGEGTEVPVETDIGLLLEEIAAAARRQGRPLTLTAPAECVISVRPNALRRCLGNLVANAQRYGDQVWLTGLEVAEGIDILVDDDGPGIPPTDRERVFRAFARLDASRNPSTGGVGLGLTIARDVARGHGGDVSLETAPQGGLRARLHLPR
jgi:two-component system, OmpR family, osmolarity sensor histidine kinase EnvZ